MPSHIFFLFLTPNITYHIWGSYEIDNGYKVHIKGDYSHAVTNTISLKPEEGGSRNSVQSSPRKKVEEKKNNHSKKQGRNLFNNPFGNVLKKIS